MLIWAGALVWLYVMINPAEPTQGWCLFRAAGFDFMPGERNCAGCGIGRSINAVMHGRLTQSWNYHWLGIPALAAIVFRMTNLAIIKNNPKK